MSVVGEISALFSIITFAGDGIKAVSKELQGIVKELSRVQLLGSQFASSGVSHNIAAPLYDSITQCQDTVRDLERQLPNDANGRLPKRRKLRLLTETGIFEGFRLRVIQDRLGLISTLNTFNANLGLHSVTTICANFSEVKSGMSKVGSNVDNGFQRLGLQLTSLQGQITTLAATQTVQLGLKNKFRLIRPPEYHKPEDKETSNEHVFNVVQHCIQTFMSKGRVVERVKILNTPEHSSALSEIQLQQHAWVLLSLRLMAWLIKRKASYAQVTWTGAGSSTSALARNGGLNFLWQQTYSLSTAAMERQDHDNERLDALTVIQPVVLGEYPITLRLNNEQMADLLPLIGEHGSTPSKLRYYITKFVVKQVLSECDRDE